MVNIFRTWSRTLLTRFIAPAPKRLPPEPQRSLRRGDRLTVDELTLLANGVCPDCDLRAACRAGPGGGSLGNFACAGCGSEFNDLGPFGVERLSTPGEPDRDRLRTVYGANVG